MNITNFLTTNAKKIAIALGAIVLVLLAIGIVSDWKQRKQAEAANAFYDLKNKAASESQPATAAGRYVDFAKKYSGTPSGFEAAITAADLYTEAKDYTAALAQYSFAAEHAPDNFTKTLALYNRGVAQENAGKFQDAVASFEQAAKNAESDSLKPELLLSQARAYESLGDSKKAIDLYRSIQDKYSAKPYYANMAAAFLAKIQTKAN
jgi:predicted negative regulator of RcsB-dependent stress response